MTVLTDTMKISYVGDGVTVAFTYDFKIFNASECLVTVDGVTVTNYVVSGLGNDNGGTVTFDTAPADQSDITIMRDVQFTQLIDLRPYDPLPAETLEAAYDRIVMMVQQLNNSFGLIFGTDIPGLVTPDYAAGEYWRWADATQEVVTGVPVALTVDSASDSDVIDGTGTVPLVYTPAQLKLAVDTHETQHINLAALPGTPEPNTIYYIDE